MKFSTIVLFLSLITIPVQLVAQLNQVDDQGLKQGKWEKRYSNGNVKYKGTFKDDKPVGEFIYYDYKLNMVAKVNHLGNDSASAILYHNNKQVEGEGMYYKQEKTGFWKFYDNTGAISAVESFKNGVKNGPSKTYFLNGQVSRETMYLNGFETGYRVDYYEDGTKRFEGRVIDGVFEGEITFYYSNGKPKMSGVYSNAVRDGIWTYYDENGLPTRYEHYEKGELKKTSK